MNDENVAVRYQETLAWVDANMDKNAKNPIPVDNAYVGHWQHPEADEGGLMLMLQTQDTGKTITFQLDAFASSVLEGCLRDIRSRLQNAASQTQEDSVSEPQVDSPQ
jgi:hypothetical protein